MMNSDKDNPNWPSIGVNKIVTRITLVLGAAIVMLLVIRYIFL
jgi:hypothetical protein